MSRSFEANTIYSTSTARLKFIPLSRQFKPSTIYSVSKDTIQYYYNVKAVLCPGCEVERPPRNKKVPSSLQGAGLKGYKDFAFRNIHYSIRNIIDIHVYTYHVTGMMNHTV